MKQYITMENGIYMLRTRKHFWSKKGKATRISPKAMGNFCATALIKGKTLVIDD